MNLSGEALSGVVIFSELSLSERTRIAKQISYKKYTADNLIVSRRNLSFDIYFVITGSVRVANFSMQGKEVSYRDESAGAILGELSALDGQPRSADLIALTDSVIGSMSASNFKLVLQQYPSVNERLLGSLVKKIRSLSDRIFEYGTLGINNRLHSELLRMAREINPKSSSAIISPPPKHSDLAARICTHREAITKELNRLSRAGVISKTRRELVINDVDSLQQLVDEALGEFD